MIYLLLDDPHMLVRERCASAISKVGKRGEVASSSLLDAFEKDDYAVQISLVRAMGRLVPRGDGGVVRCLLEELEDEGNCVNMLLEVLQAIQMVSLRPLWHLGAADCFLGAIFGSLVGGYFWISFWIPFWISCSVQRQLFQNALAVPVSSLYASHRQGGDDGDDVC